MKHAVLGTLKLDLILDEHPDKLELVVKAEVFSLVTILEVVRLHVESGAA